MKDMKTVNNSPKPKLFGNKFLTYIMQLNPFRGELVEVEMHVVGRQIVYTYTKVKKGN